jgi:hypothetical protein
MDHVVLVPPLVLVERRISNGKITLTGGEFLSYQRSGDYRMTMKGMPKAME